MNKKEYKAFKAEYYTEVLENGLTVVLYPNNEFNTTYGLFTSKFGSLDNIFKTEEHTEFITLKNGVAHFLEHKIFEMENGQDASEVFSSLGASSNAYTTYDSTSYLFQTTSNRDKCIELLLDFVQNPAFTKQTVEAEKGIIEQELLMYLDNPQSVAYNGIQQNLFAKNSVKYEIGGTVEDVMSTTYEDLMLAYNTFYHPSNMILTITGKMDLDETIKLIKENQLKKDYSKTLKINRKYYPENNIPYIKERTVNMDIIIPRTVIGLKIGYENLSIDELITDELALGMLLDLAFDDSSNHNEYLEKNNIINNSFAFYSTYEDTYAYIEFSTETTKVDEFYRYMNNALIEMKNFEIVKEKFEVYKKVLIANFIRKHNSMEAFARSFTNNFIKNTETEKVIVLLNKLEIADLEHAKRHFVKEAISTFTIMPTNKLT